MKATIPVSSSVGHCRSTELQMKQGWKEAAEGKSDPAEDFSLWALVRGEKRCPLVSLSGWRGQDLETEKAETCSWCDCGNRLPEERAGCQNCSPSLKQGVVQSPGLTGRIELLSHVPLPCASMTGCPGTLCLAFQH